MRAVNLLPADQRRGSGSPGRAGHGPYVLLGVLAAAVVAVGVYVLSANQVNSNRTKLAESQQEAASLEQQAAAFRPYKEFSEMSRARVQTVSQLADSRFDWERVMRQLARAMPGDVWLTSLVGTVAPGVSLDGGASTGSATGGVRSALNAPAVELVGCTESQSSVSRVMARLRTLNGVQRVSLASSEKSDAAGGGGASAGGSDCRNGSSKYPQFQIVVFFEAPKAGPGAPAPAPGAGAAPVAAGGSK